MSSEKNHYQIIVLGVGSMGSAACWHLAKRGYHVLGLEQFNIVHERGSHTGQSRIIRKAYFEHPDYVPLLQRAYHNWEQFQQSVSSQIYHKTGILYMGKPNSEVISGTHRSASQYHIPLQEIDRSIARTRYSSFNIPDDFDVFIEPDAGFVTPEKAISLYTKDAISMDAEIRSSVKVERWIRENNQIKVFTSAGNFTSDKLVITAGSWSTNVIPKLRTNLKVTRQILAWINPVEAEKFTEGNFPCWFVDDPERGLFYGFPIVKDDQVNAPGGLKLALHQPGDLYNPDEVDNKIPTSAIADISYFLKKYFPVRLTSDIVYKQCLYTYSEDSDFIIDYLPGYENNVTIACGFSGHGFKFVSVVGEILADLSTKGKTDLPIEFLSLRRFSERLIQ
jgi:sarcosine oxidase